MNAQDRINYRPTREDYKKVAHELLDIIKAMIILAVIGGMAMMLYAKFLQ